MSVSSSASPLPPPAETASLQRPQLPELVDPFESLPDELLILILSSYHHRYRFSILSLLSRRWRRLALLSTTSLSLAQGQLDRFPPNHFLALAPLLPRLQHITLTTSFHRPLPEGDSLFETIATLPTLTRLDLSSHHPLPPTPSRLRSLRLTNVNPALAQTLIEGNAGTLDELIVMGERSTISLLAEAVGRLERLQTLVLMEAGWATPQTEDEGAFVQALSPTLASSLKSLNLSGFSTYSPGVLERILSPSRPFSSLHTLNLDFSTPDNRTQRLTLPSATLDRVVSLLKSVSSRLPCLQSLRLLGTGQLSLMHLIRLFPSLPQHALRQLELPSPETLLPAPEYSLFNEEDPLDLSPLQTQPIWQAVLSGLPLFPFLERTGLDHLVEFPQDPSRSFLTHVWWPVAQALAHSLTYIDVHANISSLVLPHLAKFPALQTLKFASNATVKPQLDPANLPCAWSLKQVVLNLSQLSQEDAHAILASFLANCPNLRSLFFYPDFVVDEKLVETCEKHLLPLLRQYGRLSHLEHLIWRPGMGSPSTATYQSLQLVVLNETPWIIPVF